MESSKYQIFLSGYSFSVVLYYSCIIAIVIASAVGIYWSRMLFQIYAFFSFKNGAQMESMI